MPIERSKGKWKYGNRLSGLRAPITGYMHIAWYVLLQAWRSVATEYLMYHVSRNSRGHSSGYHRSNCIAHLPRADFPRAGFVGIENVAGAVARFNGFSHGIFNGRCRVV